MLLESHCGRELSLYLPSLETARTARISVMQRSWRPDKCGSELLAQAPHEERRIAAIVLRLRSPEISIDYVYCPRLPYPFEVAVMQLFEQMTDPFPECLRIELSPRPTGPYREQGREGEHVAGFQYSDPLATVRRVVGAHAPSSHVRAYAWPILWLRYGPFDRQIVLLVRPDRAMHAIVRDE